MQKVVENVLKLGRRSYTSGTKRLVVSYPERNNALNRSGRSMQYPLLAQRSQKASISRIKDIVNEYKSSEHKQQAEPIEYEVRGRVNNVRYAGKGLMFIDLSEGGSQIQIVVNSKKLGVPLTNEQSSMHGLIRRGDAISAVGKPWRTRAGELSLLSSDALTMLSPSLHPSPDASVGRTSRKHNRVAELKAFDDSRTILKARSLVVRTITDFLEARDFSMVTTPHLSTQRGGASANTFNTALEDGRPSYLRVAPELWLKRLIIGGFDRVFEIGYSYRNEGIDSTHNPEFTTCEFYMSFATLTDLKRLTEDMSAHVATRVSQTFPEFAKNCSILLSATKTIDFVHEIERLTGKTLVLETDYLKNMCEEASIEVTCEDDIAKLLDRLAAHYIEPQCKGPTFIENHPSVMAPLAKEFERDGMILSKRFEMFINGREFVNAYEEENDPQLQLAKLRSQDPAVPDRSFVEALEWGLPPTGGWGLGVDRSTMSITGCDRINDVLSFGDLNQVQRL